MSGGLIAYSVDMVVVDAFGEGAVASMAIGLALAKEMSEPWAVGRIQLAFYPGGVGIVSRLVS